MQHVLGRQVANVANVNWTTLIKILSRTQNKAFTS